METTNNQEEEELRIKIVFDNNTSITISVTKWMLNEIMRIIGEKEGNSAYSCINDNEFVCAFVPNKIMYLVDVSAEI